MAEKDIVSMLRPLGVEHSFDERNAAPATSQQFRLTPYQVREA
jgi:hypothetical protein